MLFYHKFSIYLPPKVSSACQVSEQNPPAQNAKVPIFKKNTKVHAVKLHGSWEFQTPPKASHYYDVDLSRVAPAILSASSDQNKNREGEHNDRALKWTCAAAVD